jgi:MFS family permease
VVIPCSETFDIVVVLADSARIGLVLYTLGSGFQSFARSLLSSLVKSDMVGTLFTTLAMMDTVGTLLAGPIVALVFGWSVKQDGVWRGMPFLLSFFLCGLAGLALSQVRATELPEEEASHSAPDEESPLLSGMHGEGVVASSPVGGANTSPRNKVVLSMFLEQILAELSMSGTLFSLSRPVGC